MKKLEHNMSARRDIRTYLVLVFGVFFVAAGLMVDPATNSLLDRAGRKLGKAIARGLFGNWL